MVQQSSRFYAPANFLLVAIIIAVYLGLSSLLIGFKTDQLVLSAIFAACFLGNQFSRKFIIGFSIFIVYWILFDYMKAFPNYKVGEVHIASLYNAEKGIFGFTSDGLKVTPNEFWLANHQSWLDVLTGVFYLCWIPVPLAFAAYLFLTNKQLFLQFSLSFVLVNMIGFVIYYVYPAAPPWYIQLHGDHFIATTPGNTAGLQRFDDFFGVHIFKSIYEKSSNVFAAMPSLHSSYPVIVLYYGLKQRKRWLNVFFGTVMIGIWFAAVYTSHHYMLDVLCGITCAILAILLFQKLLLKTAWFKRFLQYFESKLAH